MPSRSKYKKKPATKLLVLLTLLVFALQSQAGYFQRIGATNGLEARVVSSLLVDHDGYLWVGSREGLYRYDGYKARAFLPDPSDPHSISDADIRFILQDRQGTLWICTNNGGINHYDPESGQFERYLHAPEDPESINDNNVYFAAEDSDGNLWFTTEKGLARLNRTSGRFTRFTHDPENARSLSTNRSYALYSAPDGTLWISTLGGGLNRWDPGDESFTRYDLAALADGPKELNSVFSMRSSGDGRLWIGTRNGLLVLDPERQTAASVPLGIESEDDIPVTSMDVDAQGRVWLTTMNDGVLLLDPATSVVRPLHPGVPGDPGNVPVEALVTLHVSGGNVFVGTWGNGVFRTITSTAPFELLNDENMEGAVPNYTVSAIRADARGKPWVGYFGGGVLKVDVEDRSLAPFADSSDPIYHAGVLDIALTQDGTRYAATSRGLFSFDEQGKTLEVYEPETPGGLGSGYVRALQVMENGDLWVGMGGSGLYHKPADGGSFRPFTHDPGDPYSLGGNYITALMDDGGRGLWVGTRSNGLNRCRTDLWRCERLDGSEPDRPHIGRYRINDVYRSRRGRIWIATDGAGLNELVLDDSGAIASIRSWNSSGGLLDDAIMAIAEDLDESLWLSTRQGLSRLDPDTGEVVNHVNASGLPVSHFNAGAVDADDDYIYFGSVKGLLVIRKGTTLRPRSPSTVRATEIQTANRGEQLQTLNGSGKPITIPYGSVLSMEFAVLDFTEAAHEYAYRMDSTEPWTGLGPRRDVTFFGLAPGTYEVQARGRDAFGLWGTSDPVELVVLPPFWMEPWFRIVLAVLLIFLAVGVHRARLSRERRIAREVQRLGEKREAALESALGDDAELAILTPRQKEVLQLLAEGYSTREIAEMLDVSVKTVHAHRANLMERLDIHDVPGLVRLAIRTGIVSPQDI